jgi:hypothetical protein
VGVDIGSTSVKLVELSGSPRAFELENISVVAVPDDASSSAYGKAMSLVLEGKDLVTNRTAISVSGRKVHWARRSWTGLSSTRVVRSSGSSSTVPTSTTVSSNPSNLRSRRRL